MPPPDDEPDLRLEAILQRHGDWIRRRLRSLFPTEWEDMVQDVMVKIGEALPGLRAARARSLRAWIARTLRSVCVDEFRRRARRPVVVEDDREVAGTDPPVEDVVARAEHVERLESRGWSLLSERERSILQLRFRDGLSFRQIAEVLGVPQGSVAGWYSRALARLREVLQ